ncbi:MAG: hypothetical protein ACRDKE_10450, partial [Solirubrobacterales bacterium]
TKVDPTGATGSTAPASEAPVAVAPVTEGDVHPVKPVVEKDETTVSLGQQDGVASPAGASESPGLPTGGQPTAPTEPSAPSAGSGPSGLSGSTSSTSVDGSGSTGDSGGATGPTE